MTHEFRPDQRIFSEEEAARWVAMVFRAYPEFSDLDLQSEMQPVVMVHGRRLVLPRPMDHNEIVHVINAMFPNGWAFLQRDQGGLNTAYTLRVGDGSDGMPERVRLRFNAVMCRDPMSASAKSVGAQITMRTISEIPPDWVKLKIPREITDNFFFPDGLVLVTGPTGSGKTTLLAAMIQMALHDARFEDHKFTTLEQPIEFIYQHPRVVQQEVPRHIVSFEKGVEEAMRRRPNFIMVGESRDRPTILSSITAAMTGHQVATTLHTTGVANSVSRMIKAFPRDEAESLAADLADALRLVVSQRLFPAPDGTLQAVREWLVFTESMRMILLNTPLERMTAAIAGMVKENGHSFAVDAHYWREQGRLTDLSYARIMSSFGA